MIVCTARILLLCCYCGILFTCLGETASLKRKDAENYDRSYKRELELFQNEMMDDWEHDDNEYLSRRDFESDENAPKMVDSKRWLDVDAKGEDSLNLFKDNLPDDGAFFQDDIIMSPFVREVFNDEASKRDAVSLREYYWKNGIVYYQFDPDIDEISKIQIKNAIKEYHRYTCIKFVLKKERDGVHDYINFMSNGSACYSNVGRRGGKQDVSIGSGCHRLGTPIHEIMHVLGFFHEMSRPDRDDNVQIHWTNIMERLKHNFRKTPDEIDTQLAPFNIMSVMQYSANAFSANGKKTITYKANPVLEFGQRRGFSVGDVMQINTLYNCPELNSRFEGRARSDLLDDNDNSYNNL